jgi:hypothetical protein
MIRVYRVVGSVSVIDGCLPESVLPVIGAPQMGESNEIVEDDLTDWHADPEETRCLSERQRESGHLSVRSDDHGFEA